MQCKSMPPFVNERGVEVHKLRIGGKDARRELFKGWVEVEQFTRNAIQGSFCLMKKDMVSAYTRCRKITDLGFVAGQPPLLETTLEGHGSVGYYWSACFTQVIGRVLQVFAYRILDIILGKKFASLHMYHNLAAYN